MAIQATSSIVYNHGSYQNPYFRLVPRIAPDGINIPVDCFMYPSKEAYAEGVYHLACLLFHVPAAAESTNSAKGLVNKYLLYVTEQVVLQLQEMCPSASFKVTEIPQEDETIK